MFRFCSFSKPSIQDWKNSLLKFCKWNWPILGSLVHAVSQTNRKVHRNRKTNKSKGLLQSHPTFSNTTKIVGSFFGGGFLFQRDRQSNVGGPSKILESGGRLGSRPVS